MALDEVEIIGIHDQQVRRGVVKEEVFVGLGYRGDVVVADFGLNGLIFLAQPPPQDLGRGLKVNHQIRRGELALEEVVITVIDLKLLIIQVQIGKDLVLFEDVIGYDCRVGAAVQGAQLLKALDQEGELGLKGGA